MKLIYEKSQPGRRGLRGAAARPAGARGARRSSATPAPPRLPELAEPEVLRHFTDLSTRNFGIDTGFYPLGSCTMKYNPRINERLVGLPGFARPAPARRGRRRAGRARARMASCRRSSPRSPGSTRSSLQPAAGSQGELTGLMLIRAYFADRGEDETAAQGRHPGHGARHESGQRDDGRLRADRRSRPTRAATSTSTICAARSTSARRG